MILLTDRQKFWNGVVVTRFLRLSPCQIPHFEHHGALEVPIREWFKHHPVDHAEHHRSGANSQCECKNGDQCEATIFAQAPQGISKIEEKVLGVIPGPGLTTILLHLFQPAEGHICAPPRLLGVQA